MITTTKPDIFTLESAYFKDGLNLSLEQATVTYGPDARTVSHALVAKLSSIHHSLATTIPVTSVAQAQWLANAFERLAEHMRGVEIRNSGFTLGDAEKDDYVDISFENGFRVEEVWTEEVVTSPYGSETRHVANRYIDQTTGEVVAEKPIPAHFRRGLYSGSSEPIYADADIGRPITEVTPRCWDDLGEFDGEDPHSDREELSEHEAAQEFAEVLAKWPAGGTRGEP